METFCKNIAAVFLFCPFEAGEPMLGDPAQLPRGGRPLQDLITYSLCRRLCFTAKAERMKSPICCASAAGNRAATTVPQDISIRSVVDIQR